MLKSVITVTYSVSDVDASTAAFERHLGYRPIANGTIDAALAAGWGAPLVQGRPCTLLQAASGAECYLRLVQHEHDEHYAPLKTYGWNAAEFLVQDVRATAGQLRDSSFEIIGGPRDLMNNGAAIALQAVGPGQELVYLTEINGARMQATYGCARTAVDRTFIVVLGARDHRATLDFYAQLGAGITRPRAFAIRVLSAAHELDADTRYQIAAACLDEQYRIEIDAYPNTAVRRMTRDGDIPAGLSIVSFRVDDIVASAPAGTPFYTLDHAPYCGARCCRLIGPNDEWLELIEAH